MKLTEQTGWLSGVEWIDGTTQILVDTLIRSYDSGDDEMVVYRFKYTGDKYMLNDLANNHKPTKVRITVEILDD